jgi:hypothetical protein
MIITNKNIKLDDSIVQIKGHFVSDMDGEKVMLSIKSGKYYNLGRIGGEIWELIEKEVTIKNLITTLQSNYNVDQSECEEQVISFLELLLEEGLIEAKKPLA